MGKLIPALNVSLLSDILIWAAQDAGVIPKPIRLFDGWGNWDQGTWSSASTHAIEQADESINVCGTAFCMAGQAAVQTGHRFIYESNGAAYDCQPVTFDGLDKKGRPTYKPSGEIRSVDSVGRTSLGLLPEEANLFFYSGNTFSVIAYYALNFAQVRGVTLDVTPEIINAAHKPSWLGYDENFLDTIDFSNVALREKYNKKWLKNAKD